MHTRSLSALLLIVVACQTEPRPRVEDAPSGARGGVEVRAKIQEARTLLDAGQPYDALSVLDEAQAQAPASAQVWYLRGKAAMAAGELGSSAGDFFLDAQVSFQRAAELGAGADAWLGASRAARMNLEVDQALELARAGLAAAEASEPAVRLEQPLERTLIEALFGAYVARRQAGDEAPELFAETEDRLYALTTSQPSDPWAWTQLANLHQWEADLELAAEDCERALALAPEDEALHRRFVELATAAGGTAAVLAGYERFEAEHPGHALGAWFSAQARFNQALADLRADQDSIPGFEAAEALLQRCRGIEPGYESNCLGYEVSCRAGIGWARYGQGDLEGATSAFLSMDEILPGGMDWRIDSQLLSGVTGLQFVADKYAQRGPDEFDLAGKREAAEVFDRLRERRPDNADFANNAGLFHRDACVVLELESEARVRAAEGFQYDPELRQEVAVEVSVEEAAELRAQAAEQHALAKEHAQKSYRAYQAAARLASEDVRVLNDAALVMVYHIREDVAEMEGLLARAIELGALQIADPELSPEELDALLEAWGDAHQNMGLVYLTLKDDPATARGYFERAFEIGPRPRVDRRWVEERALPACDLALAGDPKALASLEDPRLWL